MGNFFTDLISPNSGKSHKRVLSIAAGTTVISATIIDIFADVTISEVLVDACMWLAIAGMGTATLELFANRKRPASITTQETKTTVVEPQPPDEVQKP